MRGVFDAGAADFSDADLAAVAIDSTIFLREAATCCFWGDCCRVLSGFRVNERAFPMTVVESA